MLYTLDQVIEVGQKVIERDQGIRCPPNPDDCYMFSYTSGTTGDPKGVKLTHKMIVGAVYAVNQRLRTLSLQAEDIYISYLPLAHSFEQCNFGSAVLQQSRCGFYGGDILKLTEDLQVLKPTFFPSVPRLYNKIYGKIMDGISKATGLKKLLVSNAISTKMKNLEDGQGFKHGFYDAIVFKKMKKLFGGNVKVMVTGSAPISGDVLSFLKIAFCSEVLEGYGMTETCAGSCITFCGDPTTGHVGGPVQNVKIRLRDLPEMGYFHTSNPPKGEICFWGPSIMKGYYKNEEKTAEAFHNDWLLSGDVGVVFPNGSIKIVDRAKNIFKLSQGEYIAPEKLENVYIQSKYIAQIWVYGDSIRDFAIAFIVVLYSIICLFSSLI